MFGLKNIFYIDRLVTLDIQSLEATRLQTDLVTAYEIMHCLVDVSPENIRLQLCANATRGAGFRLYRKYVKKSSVAAMYCFRLPSIWSSLPSHIIHCQIMRIFISALYLYLHDLGVSLF